jgi:hypothetical protein
MLLLVETPDDHHAEVSALRDLVWPLRSKNRLPNVPRLHRRTPNQERSEGVPMSRLRKY